MFKGSEIQKFEGLEVQRFIGSKVERFRGSKVQSFIVWVFLSIFGPKIADFIHFLGLIFPY